jgi:amino acid transporter
VVTPAASRLERGLGLLPAVATNLLVMIGVGPFLTIPFMLTAMNGPHILYAWLAGAVLALCDGLVYAQLGAALPGSGGPYVYLREAYKPFGLGPLMGFLFLFRSCSSLLCRSRAAPSALPITCISIGLR